MDLTDRGFRQPQQQANGNNIGQPAPHPCGPVKKPGRFHRIRNHRLLNATYITLLFSITILIVAVVLSLFLFDGNRNKEDQFVDTGKYQAVFLNGGQVYFGKVTNLNKDYMTLTNIYYLTPNQAVQSDSSKNSNSANNFTIRKLGCELHRPQDVMVIDHSQIIFWENLKDDSSENTVPGAIKKLASQPQNCDQQSSTGTTTPTATDNSTPNSTNNTSNNSSSNSNSSSTTKP